MTNDVDLIPAPNRQNLDRLADALNGLGARVLNPGHEQLETSGRMLPRATLWQFSTAAGDVDVLNDALGAAPCADLRRRALSKRRRAARPVPSPQERKLPPMRAS